MVKSLGFPMNKTISCANNNNFTSSFLIQSHPYQSSNCILHRNRKNNPKIHVEPLKTPNSQITKEQSWSITLPDFQQYCKAAVIKTVRHCYKNRHTDRWHRLKNSEINPCMYGRLIFGEEAKKIQWWKDNLFFSKWWWENWIFTCKRIKLHEFHLILLTKINLEWLRT